MKYDVIIVGCGVSGLYSALKIGKNKSILIICKEGKKSCNSILAQGVYVY